MFLPMFLKSAIVNVLHVGNVLKKQIEIPDCKWKQELSEDNIARCLS